MKKLEKQFADGPDVPTLFDQGMDRVFNNEGPPAASDEADRVTDYWNAPEGDQTIHERWDEAFNEAALKLAEQEPKRSPSERSDRINIVTDHGLPRWTVVRRDGYHVKETRVTKDATAQWSLHGDLLSVDVWGHTPQEAADTLRQIALTLKCPDLDLAADWINEGTNVLLMPLVPARDPASV